MVLKAPMLPPITMRAYISMKGNIIKNKKNNLPTNASFYNSPNLPKNHNHVEFYFKNIKLVYNDPRRFGYFQFFSDFNSLKKKFKSYGPEPFDKKFNSKYLINYFKNYKRLLNHSMVEKCNEHVKNKILPELKRNKVVICDRFTDSTFAYQVYGKKVKINFIKNIHKEILNGIKPNLTFLLKASSKSTKQRLKKRKVKKFITQLLIILPKNIFTIIMVFFGFYY